MLRFAFVLLALASFACAKDHSSKRPTRTLVVFAAVSLREVFEALGAELERTHPGLDVKLNFAGTQELRRQIEMGAPADVFAAADRPHMDALIALGRVESSSVFAFNEPVLVVWRGASSRVSTFEALPNAARIVLGASDVPIGRYAERVLDRADARYGENFRARVTEKVVSRELNVRQILAKVSLGEADAGIVYRTDLSSAQGPIERVTIPSEINVSAEYRIAVVRGAANAVLAHEFIALVESERGRQHLEAAGFWGPAHQAVSP